MRSPSSLLEAVRTAYPSSFKRRLRKFIKDSSLSTSKADLVAVFMLLVGGSGSGRGGWEGGVEPIKDSVYPIVSSPSKTHLKTIAPGMAEVDRSALNLALPK